MSGGLNAETNGGQHVAQPGPTGPEYTTMTPPAQPGSMPGQSHLDSFFNGSGWTREDALLVVNVCSLLILIYWAQTEVSA